MLPLLLFVLGNNLMRFANVLLGFIPFKTVIDITLLVVCKNARETYRTEDTERDKTLTQASCL